MESSSQDKNLPATAHRLKKAREDGQVPRSRDLSNLAVLGGGALVLVALAPVGFEKLRSALQGQLRFDHQSLQKPELATERLVDGFAQGLMLYLPLGVAVLAIVLLTAFVSGSWALSTKPLMPDVSRINPLKGFGRLFSKQQLFDTAKLAFISVIIGVVAWQFIRSHVEPFGTLVMQPLESGLGQLGNWLMVGVGLLLLVVTLVAMMGRNR